MTGSTKPGAEAPGLGFASTPFAVLGLLALVTALVLALLAASTPRPQDATGAAEDFAVGRALPLLERLVDDGAPHPVGTSANAAMRGRVIAELEALGLEASAQAAFACVEKFNVCGDVVNVMARLPGQVQGPAVLLTAHYDSVGAGPGVSDDLVGVAVILDSVRLMLAEGPSRNPVIVLFTDGEEIGLVGAEAFTGQPWFQDVGVVVNVEARGSRGQSLMFETNHDNAWLIDAYARAAPRPVTNSLLYELYQLLPNDTDFSIYKDTGLNGLNFAYADEVTHYHTPLDDLAHLDPGSLQHHGDNVLAAARALGAIDLTSPPTGNSIFMDLVPGSVLRAPEGWAVPLAAAALLAWLLVTLGLVRRRTLTLGRALLGLLSALVGLGLATAAGFAVASAVQALTGLSEPWYSSPDPVRIAVWLAALCAVIASATAFARWVGFWGLAVGTWLLWALAALATAIVLPGASVVFLVPTLVATVSYGMALAVDRARRHPPAQVSGAAAFAAALGAFGAAYVWLPMALSVESLLGMLLSAAVAFCLAFAFVTVTPLLAQRPAGAGVARSWLGPAAMVACLVGVSVGIFQAVRVPAYTEFRPQRFTISHVVEADADVPVRATWVLDRRPVSPLPASFDPFDFEPTAPALLPGNPGRLSATAPLIDVEPPRLELLRDSAEGETRTLALRLHAGGASERLTLSLPRSVGSARLSVVDTGHDMQVIAPDAPGEGVATFNCHGAACNGLEVELHLSTPDEVELALIEQRFGLPEQGAALLTARPSTAVPSHAGDVSQVLNRMRIPRQGEATVP